MKRNKFKVEKFIDEYTTNGFNGIEAIKAVSPNLDDRMAINVKACRWLSSPEIIEGIVSRLKQANITDDNIKDIIKARLLKIILDSKSDDRNAINGSMVLSKVLGLLKDSENVQSISIFNDIDKLLPNVKSDKLTINNTPNIIDTSSITTNDTQTIDTQQHT